MTTEYTDNFGLALPDFRMGPWHDLINTDIKKIDSLLATALSAANVTPWANNTHYIGGISVLDETDATIWLCVNAHTSALAPTTFAQDRAAHPTYWTRLLTGFAPRGEWLHNTTYFPYDLVYQTNLGIFALCEQKHVSNQFGTIEDDAAYWAFLCDFSDIGTITAGAVAYSNITSPTLPNTNVQAAIDALENQTVALNNVNITQGNDISTLRVDMIVADNTKVNKSGDTMSGDLQIVKANPSIGLNKQASGQSNQVYGQLAGKSRWAIELGNGTAETGSNSGSNFTIDSCNDAGAFLATTFLINRASGNIGINTVTPVSRLEVDGNLTVTRGNLTIAERGPGWPILTLSGENTDTETRIQSIRAGKLFWQISLVDAGAAGDFYIHRHNDAGVYSGTPLAIRRATGKVEIQNDLSVGGNVAITGNITVGGQPISGGRTLLATLTANNSANLIDTTSLTATYPTYEIVFENVIPTISANQFQMRLYSGGTVQAVNYVSSVNGGVTNPSAAVYLCGSGSNGVGSSGNNVGLTGSIRVNRPSATNAYKSFYGNTVTQTNTVYSMNNIAGQWGGGTGAITGVEFSMTNGSIASGEIRIYGLT